MSLDPELLKLLANPLEPDRPPLELKGDYLVCTKTGTRFPIVDGIPQLIEEEALPPEKDAPPSINE